MPRVLAALWSFVEKLAVGLGLFNDLPPFALWIAIHSQPILKLFINEPIGSLALAMALLGLVAIVALAIRYKPPLL